MIIKSRDNTMLVMHPVVVQSWPGPSEHAELLREPLDPAL